MKSKAAISLGMATAPKKPTIPASYGRMLIEQGKRIGMSRKELAEAAGMNDLTAWRVEVGHKDSSVKAAHKLRSVLVDKGLTIPPVPVGEDGEEVDWFEEAERFGPPHEKDTTETVIRKNLIGFREEAGYDQIGAADAAGIAYDKLRQYEYGEAEPSNAELKTLAGVYGHKPGDFFEVNPPKANLEDVPWIHFRVRPGYSLTDDDIAELMAVVKKIEARFRSEKKAALEHFKGAKSRRKPPRGTAPP